MVNKSTLDREHERLRLVQLLLEADFDKKKEFQDIVNLAARLCNKTVALITLPDAHGNWIKVRIGVDHEMTPRETSFCQYVIEKDELMVVADATKDPRFHNNGPLRFDPGCRFFAGVSLTLSNGLKLGTFCLFDLIPSDLNDIQRSVLTILAIHIVFILELELRDNLRQKQMDDIKSQNDYILKIAHIQSHDIRQPLTTIMGLVGLIKDSYQDVNDEWIEMMSQTANLLDRRIHAIVKESLAEKDIKALRFSKIVEEIEDYAILLLDKDGNVENWNKGAEILKGYKAHEITGRSFSIFHNDEDLALAVPQILLQQATALGSAKNEGWRVRKDGSWFWGRTLICRIHNDLGELIGFTKVTRLLPNPVCV